ncbi:extracellular solute-binding protein [Paenibacillus doosanensis]|uniref:extracellular solute-binding protein n=1 Tax=Paenibacillus doosanensis TaxID=1229154 RepID=UPI00217F5750|nr:extracellular solute-binding protein [Paenibacillus doosanensis]MCS7463407.1 extracellular solute-binding protein [Paenibacillus doosanensis]
MMKRKRNRLTNRMRLGAAAVLAVSALLAGCSGSDQEGRAGRNAGGQKPEISATVYDRGLVPQEEGTIEQNRWTEWIDRNGPVHVKFTPIPRNDATAKLTALFASGTAPELIFDYSNVLRGQLYTQKQMMPVDDMIAKYSTTYKQLLEKYPVLRTAASMPDGKMYGFGVINGLQANHALFIRADWLNKLNLETPKTTEELYQVMKAFTEQDPDGNRQKDTYGTSLAYITNQIVNAMFQNVKWVVEDGKLIHDWERAKAAAAFKKRLYDEGLVDPDYLTDRSGQKAQQDWVNGKIGMWGGQITGAAWLQIYESLKKNNPSAEVIVIPLPRSPYGQFSPTIQNPVQITAIVNSQAKNPEAIMKYIDFISSDEAGKTLKYGIEGTHYKQGPNGCPIFIDKEKEKQLSYAGDYRMLFSPALEGKCGRYEETLNLDHPQEKEFYTMMKQAGEYYLSPERPIADITHGEHMPIAPDDIQLIDTSVKKPIDDIWIKAIVSGAAYTPDQALAEAKSLWERAGGKQVDDWYAQWYSENKDKALLRDQLYQFKRPE